METYYSTTRAVFILALYAYIIKVTAAHWLTVYIEHFVIINCYISDSSVLHTGKKIVST